MNKLTHVFGRLLVVGALVILISTCSNLFKPGLGDKVDLEPPEVTLDSHKDGRYLSGAVTFGGSFSDDQGGTSVRISTNGGETFTDVSSADEDAGVWSHEIDTTTFSDNEYEVRVRVIDAADKSTDAKVLVYFDNTAPAVLVRSPQAIEDTFFNQTISVSGDAYDPFTITNVTLALYDGSGNLIHLRRTEQALSEAQSGGGTKPDGADGTNSWSYPFDTTLYTAGIEDFSLKIAARDRAGNESATFYHSDSLRAGLGSIPTVNQLYQASVGSGPLAGTDLSTVQEEKISLRIDQEKDLPRFEFSQPSASNNSLGESPVATGAVTDDDGVDRDSIQVLINLDPAGATDADWVDVTTVSGSGGRVNWEHDLGSLAQGPHTIAVRATDIEGQDNTSSVLNYSIDYGPPLLILDQPSPGSYHNSNVTVSGTVEDGAGIDYVEVSSDNGATYVDATVTQISAPGAGGTARRVGVDLHLHASR